MINESAITLFGNGALGGALLDFFTKKRYKIYSIWSSNGGSVFDESIGAYDKHKKPFPENSSDLGDIIFLSVPDHKVSELANQLSELDINWSGKFVIHNSGSLPLASLKSLADKGAKIASMHPIQTFHRGDDHSRFKDINISLVGDEAVVGWLEGIIQKMEAKALRIDENQKQAIHLSAVMASNYLVVLMNIAEEILKQNGVDQSIELLKPLIDQTLSNIFEKGASNSLTGPISRGDSSSVKLHLNKLSDQKTADEIYRVLGKKAIGIAISHNNLSKESADLLLKLLIEKTE